MVKTECVKEFYKWVKVQKEKAWKKKKKAMKEKIKTHSEYQRELQPIINKIARLIDFGHPCMMCGGEMKGRVNGCHYHAVGGNNSLRFNLMNIWSGCHSCNGEKGGNLHEYDLRLIEHYGTLGWEHIKFELPSKYPFIKLDIEELKEVTKEAKRIMKELEKDLRIRGGSERWDKRMEINKMLKIYK